MDADQEACTALVESHARMVGTVIWRATGDADVVEDLAQETFILVWKLSWVLPRWIACCTSRWRSSPIGIGCRSSMPPSRASTTKRLPRLARGSAAGWARPQPGLGRSRIGPRWSSGSAAGRVHRDVVVAPLEATLDVAQRGLSDDLPIGAEPL
jgi:hypothetical protein